MGGTVESISTGSEKHEMDVNVNRKQTGSGTRECNVTNTCTGRG